MSHSTFSNVSEHTLDPWFALQTRSGNERTCQIALENKGYDCYVPFAKRRRKRSDRVVQAHEPLFPGYLFCRFDPNRRLEVLQTSAVIDVLRVGRVPSPIDESEVRALLQAESANLEREPCSYFRAGEPVSIVGGPLKGVSGRVADICQKTKLILDVSLLQRSVSVEVSPEWVWAASDVA